MQISGLDTRHILLLHVKHLCHFVPVSNHAREASKFAVKTSTGRWTGKNIFKGNNKNDKLIH